MFPEKASGIGLNICGELREHPAVWMWLAKKMRWNGAYRLVRRTAAVRTAAVRKTSVGVEVGGCVGNSEKQQNKFRLPGSVGPALLFIFLTLSCRFGASAFTMAATTLPEVLDDLCRY